MFANKPLHSGKHTVMELQYYLSVLWRRKWLILFSALSAAAVAFYLIGKQTPIYKSETILSTGVIDYTGINSDKDNPYLQQLQVDMRFNNLIQFVTSRRCLNLLSFHLLNHDLDSETFDMQPFRTEVDLSPFKQEDLIGLNQLLETKIQELKPQFDDPEKELFFNKVAKAFKYDYETLKTKHFGIGRMGETDYIRLSFVSENPELSAFAVSKFSTEFINYFESLRNEDNQGTIKYLAESAKEKKNRLDAKQDDLKAYKEKGQLVDLESQRVATVDQIKELEQQKNDAQKTINANTKTIRELEGLLQQVSQPLETEEEDNSDRINTNKKIINLQNRERDLMDKLFDGLSSKKDRRQIEQELKSVKKQLKEEIERHSSQYQEQLNAQPETEDRTIANDLYQKKLKASIELTNAEESMRLINNKLAELRARAKSYVSDEAYVLNLEREIEIAKEEYEGILKELNKERFNTDQDESPLTIIEHAQVPEEPESNRKLLFTVFSGVIGGGMCTFLIFLFTFLDNTLHSPNRFKSMVNLPLLGNITKVNTKKIDLKALFATGSIRPQLEKFKELIRNVRYNLEQAEDAKIFLITSPRQGEGKSFLITALAHALSLKQKRVLIIDTNLKQNTLSRWSIKPNNTYDVLNQILVNVHIQSQYTISILKSPYNNLPIESISNSGRTQSPLEGISSENFRQFLEEISRLYDYVLMEGAALNDFADTKELVDFCDKVIAVFDANSTIRQPDRSSIEFLESLGHKFEGALLNKINIKNLN